MMVTGEKGLLLTGEVVDVARFCGVSSGELSVENAFRNGTARSPARARQPPR